MKKKKLSKPAHPERAPWDIVSEVLKMLRHEAKVGRRLIDLNAEAENLIIMLGGESINKGYSLNGLPPFPAAVCMSVNSVIAHGIPTEYALRDGDLVSFDLGVRKDGVCGDAALTVGIGSIAKRDARLLETAREALQRGIEVVRPGIPVREIGYAIASYVLRRGCVVNHSFCGHGIGAEMHMKPDIVHYFDDRIQDTLSEGMMICIEPMVTESDKWGVRMPNGWTFVTKNGRNSAVFEHQILVTHDGFEILSSWDK